MRELSMKMNNNFDTIGLIISLILSDNFTASVDSLATACNVPTQQMRKYLAVIFDNKNLLTHFSPSPKSDDENEEDYFINTAQDFLSKIISGNADTEPIYLIDMNDFIDDYLLLPISSVEAGYIRNAYPKLIQNQRASLFEIKDSLNSVPKPILEKYDIVQNAIFQNRKIEFKYKSPKFDLANIVCSPATVIQNLTTNVLYIKDTENNYYRIDRIKSKIRIMSEPSDLSQYIPSSYQKNFWGNEYQEHGEPIHIKLRISTGTTNIIQKIKSDTALRSTGKLYKEGDFYYYEDDILGMPDFRRWMRSYGSSITILEPQTLIKEITDSTKKTLYYYEKLNSIIQAAQPLEEADSAADCQPKRPPVSYSAAIL